MKIYTRTGDKGETSLYDGARVAKDDIRVESYISRIEQVNKFIVPGSTTASAALHVARTVCRRAERRILTLSRDVSISADLLKYVNRLSDCIYTLARYLEGELIYM